jgi:phage-related protein
MKEPVALKPIEWIGSSLKELKLLPDVVNGDFGFALYEAQRGERHVSAKPLKGFGGAGVLEIVSSYDGSTFRAIYTVRFRKAIYVLHVFQKKSKSGIKTPYFEIELIERRLKAAADHYKVKYERETH